MLRLADRIDRITTVIGRAAAWLLLAVVLIQFLVVLLRYAFGMGSIWLQESIVYAHAFAFLLAAAWALKTDAHVRVDVFYRTAPARSRALVDLWGSVAFLVPLCVLTVFLSWSYVLNSWFILERSTEVSGLPLIFALKTMIWVFAVLLGLQGVALAARALRCLRGETDGYRAAGIGMNGTG